MNPPGNGGVAEEHARVASSAPALRGRTTVDGPGSPLRTSVLPEESAAAGRSGSAPRPRAELEALGIYAPDFAPVAVDLSDNVNFLGPPPAAVRALQDTSAAQAWAYPPADPIELRSALAEYAGVSPAQVVTGCGSDDVIDGALRAFGGQGARVAFCSPTFSMLTHFARVNGLEPMAMPFGPGGDIDAEALLAVRAAITYLCAPNNPTGSAVSRAALVQVLSRAEGLVLVDEAYGEYSGQSAVPLLSQFPNLLVTRTLSKAFGMAGLRVGYGLAAPEVVRALEKVRGPYKVNALGLRAAVAALREDVPWVRRHVERVLVTRERLATELHALGLRPLSSAANFLCVPVADSEALGSELLKRGVRVRRFRQLPGIGDAIRVGIGPWEQMAALLAALREVRP
jgi:histidinol-phosphate aminotransferase